MLSLHGDRERHRQAAGGSWGERRHLVEAVSFLTRAEAELAGAFLRAADIPHLIQSAEGMMHGPLPAGAHVLVWEDDLPRALEALGYPRLERGSPE